MLPDNSDDEKKAQSNNKNKIFSQIDDARKWAKL